MVATSTVKSVTFLLCLGVVIFFGGLAVIPACLLFLAIPHYGLSATTKISNYFVASFCALVPGLLELVFGVRVKVCGDLMKLKGPCLLIMNHRTRLDWMFFWCYLIRMGQLPLLKIMLKASLKKVPVAGWAMQTALYFFVSRKWSEDEIAIRSRLQFLRETNFPLQFLLFPEGTDLSESNIAKSNRYAETNDLQKYKYVLHPKYKGFCLCVEEMRKGSLPLTIVDMSVGYIGAIAQNEMDFARGNWPTEIHFYAHQIALCDLPSQEDHLISWLEQRWANKEKQLEEFYKNKRFSAAYLEGGKNWEGMSFAVRAVMMWSLLLCLLGYGLMNTWFLWGYYLFMITVCLLTGKYNWSLDTLILMKHKHSNI